MHSWLYTFKTQKNKAHIVYNIRALIALMRLVKLDDVLKFESRYSKFFTFTF